MLMLQVIVSMKQIIEQHGHDTAIRLLAPSQRLSMRMQGQAGRDFFAMNANTEAPGCCLATGSDATGAF